jgi:hypothetical protein
MCLAPGLFRVTNATDITDRHNLIPSAPDSAKPRSTQFAEVLHAASDSYKNARCARRGQKEHQSILSAAEHISH